jgi:putative ABC transport system substrate-binding protein
MRRRNFLAALGALSGTRPLTVRAQHRPNLKIGYLGSDSPDLYADRLRAFHEGLNETGYAEGRNLGIEYRWAEGDNGRFPALAADLVRLPVAVIAAPGSTPAALAAKAATTTIPIVFAVGADPVQLGLVASLSRPGGNVTGAASLNVEIGRKRLNLLKDLVPDVANFGLLINPSSHALAEIQSEDAKAAATNLGLHLSILSASNEAELNSAFSGMRAHNIGAVVITNDAFFISESRLLAALATRYSIPAIHQSREFAAAGGLVSYGGSVLEAHRLAGVYVARILGGARPADLPVAQSAKIEMTLNLATAKVLGLRVPPPIIAGADEVID